jgi:hypothetical protein
VQVCSSTPSPLSSYLGLWQCNRGVLHKAVGPV